MHGWMNGWGWVWMSFMMVFGIVDSAERSKSARMVLPRRARAKGGVRAHGQRHPETAARPLEHAPHTR